ncbi:DMT family transporter [Castellaniella sp. GW247-6E4]|uniref:DMT family transporter n=1 Tax=Castellaniella sp. GW247-6E4 TaxID=3140380 RepID=UPI003315CC66
MSAQDGKRGRTTGRFPAVVTAALAATVIIAWGTNYPLLKLAVQDMPPLTFSALRSLGGAVIVALLILGGRLGPLLPPKEERVRFAVVGILQFALVIGLATVAMLVLPAGRTVAIIYTMPLWAALFDMLLLGRRLTPRQVLGIAVSLAGLLLFLDPMVLAWGDPGVPLGTALVLTAAVGWGLGAVLYKSYQWKASFLSQTLWQLLTSGVVFVVLALVLENPLESRFTVNLVLILLWNFIVPSAVAIWAWSRVLDRMSPSVAGQMLMSTPFVGIVASAIIFGEDIPPVFAASTLLIIVGGVLVLLRQHRAT